MLKVLLVDDNNLTLSELNEIIGKFGSFAVVVGQAMDGLSALTLVRELCPNLVIMDVEMPKMNGVEAATQIGKQYPAVKILALSNYDNFQYLHGMMKAGAVDYLLKHELSPELVKRKLTEIAGLLNDEQQDAIREQYYSLIAKQAFLHSLITESKMDDGYKSVMLRQKEFCMGGMLLTVFQLVNYLPTQFSRTPEQDSITQSVLNVCSNLFASIGNGIITPTGRGEFAVILNFPLEVSQKSIRVKLTEYLMLLQGNLKRLLGHDIIWETAVIHNDLGQLPAYYRQASAQLKNKPVTEPQQEQTLVTIDILDERELIDALCKSDIQLAHRILDRVFRPVLSGKLNISEMQEMVVQIVFLCKRFVLRYSVKADMNIIADFEKQIDMQMPPQQIADEIKALFSDIIKDISKYNTEHFSMNVQKAILFLHEHYADNISLSDTAQSIGISDVYLSKIFKTEVGASFVDYLTRLRIQKARYLLGHKELSISDISELSGFRSYNYFIKVFREQIGKTPVKFRGENLH